MNEKREGNNTVDREFAYLGTTPGNVEDHYFIGNKIGKGAFSVVKEAYHKQTKERFAIKSINKRFMKPKLLEREIFIMTTIRHENVVSCKQIFESPNDIHFVLEFVGCGELYQEIVDHGEFSESEARDILLQMLDAVEYLHENGIAHRDLKPENILCKSIVREGKRKLHVKVADFGFSKIFTEETLKTQLGSPTYVAPEILHGGRYTEKVDMWALGVITYVMLTGCFPFYDDGTNNFKALYEKILRVDYTYPEQSRISTEAQDFISDLLVLEPNDRMDPKMCRQHPWLKGYIRNLEVGLSGSESSYDKYLPLPPLPAFPMQSPFGKDMAMTGVTTATINPPHTGLYQHPQPPVSAFIPPPPYTGHPNVGIPSHNGNNYAPNPNRYPAPNNNYNNYAYQNAYSGQNNHNNNTHNQAHNNHNTNINTFPNNFSNNQMQVEPVNNVNLNPVVSNNSTSAAPNRQVLPPQSFSEPGKKGGKTGIAEIPPFRGPPKAASLNQPIPGPGSNPQPSADRTSPGAEQGPKVPLNITLVTSPFATRYPPPSNSVNGSHSNSPHSSPLPSPSPSYSNEKSMGVRNDSFPFAPIIMNGNGGIYSPGNSRLQSPALSKQGSGDNGNANVPATLPLGLNETNQLHHNFLHTRNKV